MNLVVKNLVAFSAAPQHTLSCDTLQLSEFNTIKTKVCFKTKASIKSLNSDLFHTLIQNAPISLYPVDL